MSRRDTIIIAVLVNAALLMVLFVTAIRSGDSKQEEGTNGKGAALAKASSNGKFQQDDILNEYIATIPPLTEATNDRFFTFEEGELALAPVPLTPIQVTEPLLPSSTKSSIQPIETSSKKGSETFVNITVKKGDFLEKIAKANYTTVSAIMRLNNLSSTQLKIGQVLKVPLAEAGKISPPSAAAGSSLLEGEYYIVREGDNPWLIASRNKINLEELLRLNDLDEQKAKRLRPGDKLKIR